MQEELKTMQFEAEIKDVKILNSEISKGKAYILYTLLNRNNSYISKEAVESALDSLFYIPVVGEYKKEKGDMGSHGGRIEITDEGIEWIQTTVPYGCVPSKEDANVQWETITLDDGTEKEYLTCDVYLWSGRYPELEKTITEYSNQSMELNVLDGNWKKLKDEKTGLYSDAYEIKEFNFSSLCLLGQDVIPCFEGAKVVSYSLDKDEFKSQFAELLKEIKEFSLQNQDSNEVDHIDNALEGGEDDMTNENKEEVVVVDEDTIIDETAEETSIKQNAEFEAEAETETDLETEDESESEEETVDSNTENFELSHDDIRSRIYQVLNPIGEDGYHEWNYWIMEVFQTYCIVSDEKNADTYYKINYSIDGENVSVDLDNKTQIYLTWLTQEEKDKVEAETFEINTKLETLEKENKELSEFKLSLDRAEKLELFEDIKDLSEDDVQDLKEKIDTYSKDELEKELIFRWGKKKIEFEKLQKNKEGSKEKMKFALADCVDNSNKSIYSDIVEKHKK